MEIEPVSEIMPVEYRSHLDEFRVTILKPEGCPNSIQWNEEVLSLNKTINKLEAGYGAHGVPGVCRSFLIVDCLTDIAKGLAGPEGEIADEVE
jgi:hypothetical protein